jgi:hypothetical protein
LVLRVILLQKNQYDKEFTTIPNFTFNHLDNEQSSSLCAKAIRSNNVNKLIIKSSTGEPLSDRLFACSISGSEVQYHNIEKTHDSENKFDSVILVSIDKGHLIVDKSTKEEVINISRKKSLLHAMSNKNRWKNPLYISQKTSKVK